METLIKNLHKDIETLMNCKVDYNAFVIGLSAGIDTTTKLLKKPGSIPELQRNLHKMIFDIYHENHL